MNRHTFMDAVKGKREAHINEIHDDRDDDDDEHDEDDEGDVRQVGKEKFKRRQERGAVDGEEEDCEDMYNDNGDQMTAFNLKDEREGGHFDENMNYIFHKETGEADAWLANMDEVTMERSIGETVSAIARQKKLHEAREKAAKESGGFDATGKSVPALKTEILGMMLAGERVSDAMRRFKNGSAAKKKTGQANTANEAASKADLNKLMVIADELLSRENLTGIYEMTYEALEASTTLWEYIDASGAIQGPFSSTQLSEWKKMGYFTGETAVMMRKVSAPVAGAVLDRKRHFSVQGVSSGGGRRGLKRVKFEVDVGGTSISDDLMNDLDDDDGGGDDGDAQADTARRSSGWISSDMIEFGDGGKVEGVTADDDDDDNGDDDDADDAGRHSGDGGDDSD